MEKPDFSDFIKDADAVKKIDTSIEEEPILDTKVEFTYSHLMAKLLRLPKYLQLEIGKALIMHQKVLRKRMMKILSNQMED